MLHILLVLHLMLFLLSFAFTAGVGFLLARVANSRDARIIHAAFVSARPISIAGSIGWILTALVGAALASAAGIPFDTPWLLWSYLAFVILAVTGALVHKPWQAKVIAASADGQGGPALDALLRSPVAPVASLVSILSVIALVYLMSARMG